jgi:hypothetical protein
MPECRDIGHERSSNCACSSPSWQPAKRMDLGDGVSLAPPRLGPDDATVVGEAPTAYRDESHQQARFPQAATKNYLNFGAKAPLSRHETQVP